MRLKINPLDQFVKRAERRINFHCSTNGQDVVHDRKRTEAKAIVAGVTPSAEFEEAAEIENMTTLDLAKLIASKSDDLMIKENKRRTMIVAVRAAKTVDEVNAILDANNVPPHFEDIKQEML